MGHLFDTVVPFQWFIGDVIALLILLTVVIWVINNSKHPISRLLEIFGFIFLYAAIFENFAVVQGWYTYGESFLMIGDVPLAVPMIEVSVFVTTIALLEKMKLPKWTYPMVIGLFGMLQDFSLDPVAVKQIYTVIGKTSGRWSWLTDQPGVEIYNIPVFNFPGWMLIMLYFTACVLIGRYWFKRTGYKKIVGYAYPILASIAALLLLVSPLSRLLLWIGPIGSMGSQLEWIMLAIHLLIPTTILIFIWRGSMFKPIYLKQDFPIFLVIIGFHLIDITFALVNGYTDILWLVLLSSFVHIGLLALIYLRGKKVSN